MTEAEWLDDKFLSRKLRFVRGRASDRALRLFAAACCRRVEHLIRDPDCLTALRFAEQMAEGGTAGRKGRSAVCAAAREAFRALSNTPPPSHNPKDTYRHQAEVYASLAALECVAVDPGEAAESAAKAARSAHGYAVAKLDDAHPEYSDDWLSVIFAEEHQQVRILRDLVQFRPVVCRPEWRSSTVLALARGIDAEAAYDRLPILADAVQDTGCENRALLDHCRGSGRGDRGEPVGGSPDVTGDHVRGCWVVDLLLGKS